MASETSYLIAGLGNPGRQYRSSRHNIGFMLLDRLADKLGVSFARLEQSALVTHAAYLDQRLLLAKPQTYMNLSGKSIASLLRFYKIPVENLLVVYDEVDLPLGTLRLRPGGGSAGQKGMLSIIEALGTQEFTRLRIGIDRPPGRMEAADYVLQDFSRSQTEFLPEVLERGVEAVLTLIRVGLPKAMTLFNAAAEE